MCCLLLTEKLSPEHWKKNSVSGTKNKLRSSKIKFPSRGLYTTLASTSLWLSLPLCKLLFGVGKLPPESLSLHALSGSNSSCRMLLLSGKFELPKEIDLKCVPPSTHRPILIISSWDSND